MKSYVSICFLLCALSAPHTMHAAESDGTPDVLDDNIEIPPFPAPPESQDALSEQDSQLIASTFSGDLAQVKGLLAKGADVNLRDKKQRTPLIFAASNGHREVVQYLLEQGAEVNASDSGGRTALLYAAKRSFNDTIAVLIDNGADVNARSKKKGITALMLAAVWDNGELVQLLLKQGADPHLTDTFGRTAKLLAEKKNNTAVVAMLPDSPAQEG